ADSLLAARVPVLRTPIPPYRVIRDTDLMLKDCPTSSNVAKSCAQVVARYSLAPLPASTPIDTAVLLTPPDKRFLIDRSVVALPSSQSGAAPFVSRGAIVDIWGPGPGQHWQDVMVIDRLSD